MSEVPGAAEEAREKVEGIMVLAGTAALLMLLNAFVAVLIVYLACFFAAEDIVGFSYSNKLLASCFITTGIF